MKKVFEIWIDDDCDLNGLCGTVIVKKKDGGIGVTCSNFDEVSLSGMVGYFYPAEGNGCKLVKTDDVVIDMRDISEEKPSDIRELDFEEMSVRLYNVLLRAGIYYYEDLIFLNEDTVKRIRNLGKRSFEELCDILKKHEIQFSDTNKVLEHVRSFKVKDTVIFDGEYYTVDEITDNDKYGWYTPPIILIKNNVSGKYLRLRKVRDVMSVKMVSRYYDGHN